MSFDGTKGRKVRVKVISAADAATLETDIQTWLDSLDEEILVGPPLFMAFSGEYTVVYHYLGS